MWLLSIVTVADTINRLSVAEYYYMTYLTTLNAWLDIYTEINKLISV